MMLLAKSLYVSFLLVVTSVQGFGVARSQRSSLTSLHLVDPVSAASGVESLAVTLGITAEEVVNIGVAVASAAAGAATQLPRIQQLQVELDATKAELASTRNATDAKLEALEDKLFAFDQEFEEQTERFKKQYDAQIQVDLRNKVDKIKQDYQFKLDIEVQKEKSKLLTEQLSINRLTDDRQEELATLRLQQKSLDFTNRELETALLESEAELNRLQEKSSKKGGFFGLFA